MVTFDFLPVAPTSPVTLSVMLLGGDLKGVVREKQLKGVKPRARANWVLQGRSQDAVERAREFSKSNKWKNISLYRNSCVTYADLLVSHLLEKK